MGGIRDLPGNSRAGTTCGWGGHGRYDRKGCEGQVQLVWGRGGQVPSAGTIGGWGEAGVIHGVFPGSRRVWWDQRGLRGLQRPGAVLSPVTL